MSEEESLPTDAEDGPEEPCFRCGSPAMTWVEIEKFSNPPMVDGATTIVDSGYVCGPHYQAVLDSEWEIVAERDHPPEGRDA